MRLPRDGREYYAAPCPVAVPDQGSTFEVQFVVDGPWVAGALVDGKVRVLVFGPDYSDTTQGTLIVASCQPRVRCTDTPQRVVRPGTWIFLDNASTAVVVAPTNTDYDGGTF